MKVLAGFIMDGKSGGIDKYLLNVLEQVSGNNQSQIQGSITLDFLTNEVDSDLEEKLATYGSKIYAIPNLKHPKGNTIGCERFWKRVSMMQSILIYPQP